MDPDLNFFSNSQTIHYTADEFCEKFHPINSSQSFMKVVTYNVRSYNTHVDDFLAYLKTIDYTPNIIILCETWLTDNSCNLANIDSYLATHTVRKSSRSGGVSAYYPYDLNVEVLDSLQASD